MTDNKPRFIRHPWILAARPKTLPAAIAPVCLGTAMAAAHNLLAPVPALAALAGAMLLQVGVNLANDYFDFIRRIDRSDRLGPMRVTQSGLIPPKRVRDAMWMVLGTAALVGLYLISVGGWPIAFIGIASILSVLAYSGGPYPLASHGLGDLFVFIFLGPVAVCGTYYVQALGFHTATLWLSVPVGFLITAVIVVNNLRDIGTDHRAGKRTLAVMIGPVWAKIEYTALISAAYISVFLYWLRHGGAIWLPLLSLPVSGMLVRSIFTVAGRAYNRQLAGTAMLALVFSLLLSLGLII